jgi:protocatechuate 3,4-dioxygenase beta subunit
MSMDQNKSAKRSLTRRQILAGAAASGSAVLGWRAADTQARAAGSAKPNGKVCILTPEAAEGPFYFDPKLVRATIAEGRAGAPLALALQLVEAETCGQLDKVRVDIWHCDGLGVYSGYARQETGSAEGETFLRGTQFTNGDGMVRFDTIYPGWYRAARRTFISRSSSTTGTLSRGRSISPIPSAHGSMRRTRLTANASKSATP